ncbi:MAG TPA: peptidoglycan-binding domain-containing protein [Thermoleophilaceae bacterium]|nr:peptidoglycan-binding domain-containing protein [Thermoleophilaceae bacterium]
MRRRRAALAAVPALGVVAVGVVVATSVGGGGGGARAAGPSRAGTAVVARRTLVDRQRVDGTLGYSGTRAVTNRLSGTITWLPRAGAVITPGHRLFEVNGEPVVLMDGAMPAYRSLRTGVADGADVRQLERGLARLGYDPGTINAHYDATTAAAVRAWQAHLGLAETGRVELGRVVFLPGARRVTDVKVSLGSAATGGGGGDNPSAKFASYTRTQTTPTPTQTTPTQTTPTQTTPEKTPPKNGNGGSRNRKPNGNADHNGHGNAKPNGTHNGNGNRNPNGNNSGNNNGNGNGDANAPATQVLSTTSTRRVVTAKVDAADQTLVAKRQVVRVELPDGRVVAGRIIRVGTVATTDSSGNDQAGGGGSTTTTITITIRLRSARAAGRLDQAPVSVQIARTTKRNVLAVPVEALVSRVGGRYAVERADGRFVNVTPGIFANGYVELVAGRIHEGDRVRVPQ